MKTQARTILSITMLGIYGFAFVGCNNAASKPVAATTASSQDGHDHDGDDHNHDHDGNDHDHDHDHDHDGGHDHASHDGHDHPEHGAFGGHMVELSNGKKTEVHLYEETDLFTVYTKGLGDVTAVQMTTTIGDKETVYEFDRTDTPDPQVGRIYGFKSPELATAVKMGKDVVKTELKITTPDGESTADYEHHSH